MTNRSTSWSAMGGLLFSVAGEAEQQYGNAQHSNPPALPGAVADGRDGHHCGKASKTRRKRRGWKPPKAAHEERRHGGRQQRTDDAELGPDLHDLIVRVADTEQYTPASFRHLRGDRIARQRGTGAEASAQERPAPDRLIEALPDPAAVG